MKRNITRLTTAIALFALVLGGIAMAEPLESARAFILLRAMSSAEDLESIDVTDPKMYKVGFDPTRNRLVLKGDDDGVLEIPFMTVQYLAPANASMLMLDVDGSLSTGASVAVPNPVMEILSFPTPVRWPQGGVGAAQVGDQLTVKSIISEAAPNGDPGERYVLGWKGGEQLVIRDVAINLNSTAAQHAFYNDTGALFIPTRLVLHDASISMDDGGVITITAGSNGTADGAFASTKFVELTSSSLFSTWDVKKGATPVANLTYLDLRLSGAFGVGTVQVDVFGYFRG